MGNIFEKLKRAVVLFNIFVVTAFALYTGAVGPFEPAIQRGVFVLLTLPLCFLCLHSRILPEDSVWERVLNIGLTILTAFVMFYALYHYERLYSDPFLGDADIYIGWLGLALVLESVRRAVGISITIIFSVFIVYALMGTEIPISSIRHSGLDSEALISQVFYGTDGVFGTPIAVVSTFIVLVMLLGSILTATGGTEMFMNLAKAIAGGFIGGPAKIAVVGSAMMGMITGATVANIATTGSVTIPMMKRAGFAPRFAGAVEALASSGGQLMPPIMGAAAFIMIDYLDMGYGQLLLHAIIPSLLFFLCVFMIVHIRAARYGHKAIPKSEMPSFIGELKERGHMWLPIFVLVYLLSEGLGIMYVAFLSVGSAMVVCQLRKSTRLNITQYLKAFEDNIIAIIPLVAICAGAGIMIGTLTATGLNLKIAYLIDIVGEGSIFLTLVLTMIACLILGMGLPTVAAYLVLATLVPASLIKLGIEPVAAHMFIFYFAIMSAVTPPVCTGAFVAAGIAQANPMQTGVTAFIMSLPIFLLPYAFAYEPTLLGIGSFGGILMDSVTAALGLVLWAIGLEGYFRAKLGMITRGGLMIAGVCLVWPDTMLTLAGLGIAAVFAFPVLRSAAQVQEPSPEHSD